MEKFKSYQDENTPFTREVRMLPLSFMLIGLQLIIGKATESLQRAEYYLITKAH